MRFHRRSFASADGLPAGFSSLVARTVVVEGGVIFVVVFVGVVLTTIALLTVVPAVVVFVPTVVVFVASVAFVGNGFAVAGAPLEVITNLVVNAEVVEIGEFVNVGFIAVVVAFGFNMGSKCVDAPYCGMVAQFCNKITQIPIKSG